MPPDTIVTDAARSIIDVGVVGSLCIILALVIWWQDKRHRAEIACTRTELKAELKAEQDAHQRTRDAQIAEIRHFTTLGESIRDQQKATETAIERMIDWVKERDRK